MRGTERSEAKFLEWQPPHVSGGFLFCGSCGKVYGAPIQRAKGTANFTDKSGFTEIVRDYESKTGIRASGARGHGRHFMGVYWRSPATEEIVASEQKLPTRRCTGRSRMSAEHAGLHAYETNKS